MLERRVFIYGSAVNKGAVLEAIRNQIPNHWAYKFDREQLMNPEYHQPGKHEGVPCIWVTVLYQKSDEPIYPIMPQEGTVLTDKADPVRIKE